jgi:hypothetical protein
MSEQDGAASLVRSDALLAVLDDPEFSFITRRERCIHGGKPDGAAMTVPVIGVAVEWEIEVNRGMYAKQAKGPTLAAALEKLQSMGLVKASSEVDHV